MITWRRVLHLGLLRLAEFLNRASHVCSSAAAGALRMRDLRERIRQSWQDFRSGDVEIVAGLTRWEKETVERFFRPGERVLVVGSGSGRELLALTDMGYQAIGVEPAALASAIARRVLAARGHPCNVIEGFIEDVALAGKFDVIMFSYYTYGLIPESRRRVDALRKVAAHLAHDGRVVISYWMRDDGAMRARAARAMAWMTRSDWRPEAGDVIGNAQYDHLFTPEEIASEATSAGLRVVFHDRISDSPVLVGTRSVVPQTFGHNFYDRDNQSLRVETRDDEENLSPSSISPTAANKPSGSPQAEAYRTWLVALENTLEIERWIQGPLVILPDGWPHKGVM